jgi:hypothetical protein
MAKEELENRGIPEHAWVKTVKSCMSPEVLDSFRTAFCSGNRTSAVAIRLLPHKRQQAYDPFEYTEWDEFCDWLLKEYVTSAHLEALQQYIDEVPCKGATAVREYVDVFNESCIYADYLSAFLGDPRMDGDMAAALENIDTPLATPHRVQAGSVRRDPTSTAAWLAVDSQLAPGARVRRI